MRRGEQKGQGELQQPSFLNAAPKGIPLGDARKEF
jgi:hypothetical protein